MAMFQLGCKNDTLRNLTKPALPTVAYIFILNVYTYTNNSFVELKKKSTCLTETAQKMTVPGLPWSWKSQGKTFLPKSRENSGDFTSSQKTSKSSSKSEKRQPPQVPCSSVVEHLN